VFNGRPSHNGNPVHGYINRYENELMTIPQHGYKSHFWPWYIWNHHPETGNYHLGPATLNISISHSNPPPPGPHFWQKRCHVIRRCQTDFKSDQFALRYTVCCWELTGSNWMCYSDFQVSPTPMQTEKLSLESLESRTAKRVNHTNHVPVFL